MRLSLTELLEKKSGGKTKPEPETRIVGTVFQADKLRWAKSRDPNRESLAISKRAIRIDLKLRFETRDWPAI